MVNANAFTQGGIIKSFSVTQGRLPAADTFDRAAALLHYYLFCDLFL